MAKRNRLDRESSECEEFRAIIAEFISREFFNVMKQVKTGESHLPTNMVTGSYVAREPFLTLHKKLKKAKLLKDEDFLQAQRDLVLHCLSDVVGRLFLWHDEESYDRPDTLKFHFNGKPVPTGLHELSMELPTSELEDPRNEDED